MSENLIMFPPYEAPKAPEAQAQERVRYQRPRKGVPETQARTPREREYERKKSEVIQVSQIDQAILKHDKAIARAIKNNHPNRKAFHEAEKQKLLTQKGVLTQKETTSIFNLFNPDNYQQVPDSSNQQIQNVERKMPKRKKNEPKQVTSTGDQYTTSDSFMMYQNPTGGFWNMLNNGPQDPSTMRIGGNSLELFGSYPLASKLGNLAPKFARGDLDGNCGAGVRKIINSFGKKTGINFNIPSSGMDGRNWASVLSRNPNFERLNVTDISQVPPGAIIAYGPSKYGSPDRMKHGHVEVVTSDGRFAYDGIANTPGGSAMAYAGRELSLREMGLMGVFVPKVA